MDGNRVQIEVVLAAVIEWPVHPGNQIGEIVLVPPRGNRIEDVFPHGDLLRHALDIDDGRLTGHRHRLLNRSHTHVGVHRGVERACQLDAVSFERVEAGQRERHAVNARAEIHHPELTGPVGDDRPDLLDECRAGRFDGHTRQNGAGRVSHDAGNGCLCMRRHRDEHETGDREQDSLQGTHSCSSPSLPRTVSEAGRF